eukprot:2617428-Amphidinium_carterae.1
MVPCQSTQTRISTNFQAILHKFKKVADQSRHYMRASMVVGSLRVWDSWKIPSTVEKSVD